MLGGHSNPNTVLLGGGTSEYQIPPYFGHHNSFHARMHDMPAQRTASGSARPHAHAIANVSMMYAPRPGTDGRSLGQGQTAGWLACWHGRAVIPSDGNYFRK